MKPSTPPKAVIYCRVNDSELPRSAAHLHWQETNCRAHAAEKGYDVVQGFHEIGSVTGGARPGLTALLAYLAAHQEETQVVIVNDLSRLARSVSASADICASIRSAGAVLEIPSASVTG